MKKLLLLILLLLAACCSLSAAETPQRIITLAPSVTEIVYALGLGNNIVGVTTYCDYPEEAKKKQKVGGMSNPSLETVVSLKPDLVVLTTDGNPKEFQERLASLKIKTYIFKARRLAELPEGIRQLGQALDVREKAEKLAAEVAAGFARFEKGKFAHPASRKKVLFIVWPEPLIVAGPHTVIDDTLTLLGQINIASTARTEYPKYSIEEVIRQAPDVLFIGKSMGMDMREVSQGFLKRMQSVPAVKNGKVYFLSDKLFRLGPRVLKGIEEMAGYLEK